MIIGMFAIICIVLFAILFNVMKLRDKNKTIKWGRD